MFHGAPLNNDYLELYASPAYAQIATLKGMNATPRKVEMMLDLAVFNTTSKGSSAILLFGKAAKTGAYFTFDDPGATAGLDCTGDFTVVRGAATLIGSMEFRYGRRFVLFGKDDGEMVSAYQDGEVGTTNTWSTAQKSVAIAPDANPLILGKDVLIYNHLRLHELWIKVNDIVVCHVRPKRLHAGGTRVPDLSPFGNHLDISGTEGTDFLFGSSWNEEPAYAGLETVS